MNEVDLSFVYPTPPFIECYSIAFMKVGGKGVHGWYS